LTLRFTNIVHLVLELITNLRKFDFLEEGSYEEKKKRLVQFIGAVMQVFYCCDMASPQWSINNGICFPKIFDSPTSQRRRPVKHSKMTDARKIGETVTICLARALGSFEPPTSGQPPFGTTMVFFP
jgi:hypothetical protein